MDAMRGRGQRGGISPSQKKPQSGSTNAARFGGNVMVHRTDVAGSVGCSIIGQAKPGHERICHASNGVLREDRACIEKSYFSEIDIYPGSYLYQSLTTLGSTKCGRRFMTAIPSVHAICVDALGPIKRRHRKYCKGRDNNAAQQNTTAQGGFIRWLFMHDISVAAPRWRWLPY
jgi:hypothetical protein